MVVAFSGPVDMTFRSKDRGRPWCGRRGQGPARPEEDRVRVVLFGAKISWPSAYSQKADTVVSDAIYIYI